ncbi:molybdenum cofactor sulfurase [Xylogone sp. PMI_703]|nr:molybdenum cofactor sulfurase [Xylogone sp. PMI_703]
MEDNLEYNQNVEVFRDREYPMLKDAIYLDHAGSTLYSKSLVDRFAADMISNLFGNPHSASQSSQLSTSRIDDTRLKVLQFFRADPKDFDVVFVANATAGIKLVMEAFRVQDCGFLYGYHQDAHTSLVGVRQSAADSRCLDDGAVERWLSGNDALVKKASESQLQLFAYPAQSNLTGRRLPLSWIERVRSATMGSYPRTYTLLDASALVSTSPLDLSDASIAPDFTVLSFYKIFGFPDLGALIVRKESGTILTGRDYFGGGTVDMVLCIKENWHAPKKDSLHESLEDGTLPFHNIMALESAIDVHKELYSSMDRVARHTAFLAKKLYDGLSSLRHGNGFPVCEIYSQGFQAKDHRKIQGPTVAFNIRNSHGAWVSNIEFEKLATVRKFHIRTGSHCNPGGAASSLGLEPWEMRQNFSAGFRCSGETDIYSGKITGMIRASIGATSILEDVEAFVSFVREFYVDVDVVEDVLATLDNSAKEDELIVESLMIYPIKSCGGLEIQSEWEVKPEGLAWDREWCLVQQGTGQALSQKRYPRMVLIKPTLDFETGLLRVRYKGDRIAGVPEEISIPLSSNPSVYVSDIGTKALHSRVCGDNIIARTYSDSAINGFFSKVLNTPCVLTRFPAGGSGATSRHAKAHMQKHQQPKKTVRNESRTIPGSFPDPPTPPDSDTETSRRPILLSNESPILALNRSSLDALNAEIRCTGGKYASASVFRANIVLASPNSKNSQPYSEDHWKVLRIGSEEYQMLGSCRRCHMICVDQDTAIKDEEPFVTLAKTRRFESKIFFGSHMCHRPSAIITREHQRPTIKVGDKVFVLR